MEQHYLKNLFRFFICLLFSCEGKACKGIINEDRSGNPDLSSAQVHEAFVAIQLTFHSGFSPICSLSFHTEFLLIKNYQLLHKT